MGTAFVVSEHPTHAGSLGWFDGLGRTVRTVERNRSPGSAGVETFATDLEYNSLGAVTRMQRGLLAGDDSWADFASGESVEKFQRYDSLGRRIRNLDPDAGEYRYAYDAIDRLVSTQDARGTINRYWYDRGGRLVAEDLGGEVAYNTTGWTNGGGSLGETCTSNPTRIGYCFDVLYGFDGDFDPPAEAWVNDLPTGSVPCGSLGFGAQGPLAGRPSWTRDRSGTVVLGYDCHGWAIWSVRQVTPDTSRGYRSLSTFDEAQRLTNELHPDQSQFDFTYTSRGLLWSVDFTEAPLHGGETRPLVRRSIYDVQGRRIELEYGDRYCSDPAACPDWDAVPGTVETYGYDARQRLSRKRALRSDGLVVLDYRYSYDSASNIVRIDDDRPSFAADPRTAEGFVPYDMVYGYDALNRLVSAEPLYAEAQPHRVGRQTWSFDSLGSMLDWNDAVGHFYGWSLGDIENGLQLIQSSESDPGVGPLPRHPTLGCPMDALDRCVPPTSARSAPAPHAIYRATGTDGDTLRAYYDVSGNMTALVVHRPAGCGREDELGTATPAAGGPDGAGCREGDDFRLLFAWDEVCNLLAVERQRLVDDGACTAPGGGVEILDPEFEEFLVPGADREDYEWCPAARLESTYDFGGQRRVKREANITDDIGRIPVGASLYVSASYEVREATWNGSTEAFENGIDARYLWNEAGILFELDSEVPDGAPSPKSRLTLTNQIGSASSVLDADLGSVSQILSQLPYGAEEQAFPRVDLTDPPAFVPRYEFTGKERDRGVGLVYFGARSLDARLGRWVSADPLAVQGSPGNAYAYAASNPIHLIDPVGLDETEAQSSATQEAGAASAFFETPAGEAAQPSSYIQPNDFDADGKPDMSLVSDTPAATTPTPGGGGGGGASAASFAAAPSEPPAASPTTGSTGAADAASTPATAQGAPSVQGPPNSLVRTVHTGTREVEVGEALGALAGYAVCSAGSVPTGGLAMAACVGIWATAGGADAGESPLETAYSFAQNTAMAGAGEALAGLVGQIAARLSRPAAQAAGGGGPTAIQPFYPPNNGFLGETTRRFLYAGERIDRFGGSSFSRFFSPAGTPTGARTLLPGTAGQPLRSFEVVKPFEVEAGAVAPAFGELGLGTQFRSPVPLETLLRRGIIREVTP